MQSLRNPVAVFVAVLSFPIAVCAAQSASGSVDGQATEHASAQVSGQERAITDRYMTSVQTELTGKIDTKNATVGQQVTAKTKQTAKLADGTTLPKGTKLVGHVTEVQAQGKGQAGSMLAMTFDHAELKNGQNLPLRSVMQAVAPPMGAGTASSDSLMADEAAGPVTAPVSGSAAGSARGGLGLGGGGGLAGGPVRSIGQTAGSTLGGVTADTRSAVGSAANTTGGLVASGGETVSGIARTTALPGVMLSSSSTADASGTLTAAGKNISLDTGTQITLGVIAR